MVPAVFYRSDRSDPVDRERFYENPVAEFYPDAAFVDANRQRPKRNENEKDRRHYRRNEKVRTRVGRRRFLRDRDPNPREKGQNGERDDDHEIADLGMPVRGDHGPWITGRTEAVYPFRAKVKSAPSRTFHPRSVPSASPHENPSLGAVPDQFKNRTKKRPRTGSFLFFYPIGRSAVSINFVFLIFIDWFCWRVLP